MRKAFKMNVEEFRVIGKEMIDYMCNYVETIGTRRVISNVEPGYLRPLLPTEAPENPEPWSKVLEDVEKLIMPGVTHWSHPNFHAYFPNANSFPAILGDMLSGVLGIIGFSWASCPACTELECVVLDWLGKAIGLPDSILSGPTDYKSGGVILGSASETVFTCLLAARAEAMKYLKGPNENFDGSVYLSKLVAYSSKEAHSSVAKACMISTIKLRILETDDNQSLRGPTLEDAIRRDINDGYFPFFAVATLGTTGPASFDNLAEIGVVCKKFPSLWLHVDAAYAGNAFVCPELRSYLNGVEFVDSISTNCNKWFLTNFDCSCMWVQDRVRLTRAMTISAAYYPAKQNSVEALDLRHLGIPLSRRFRSLKLWFVMRLYGIKGLQKYIRNHICLAKYFESLVRKDSNYEIMNDVRLGLVCFRLKYDDEINQDLLANINFSGKIHMVPTLIKGKYVIRFCVDYEHAKQEHIDYAWSVIQEHANELLSQNNNRKTSLSTNLSLDRQLSNRCSYVKPISNEQCEEARQCLTDLASPVVIPNEKCETPQNTKTC